MIQKNNKITYIYIFTCVGVGQHKPAWTACPPGGEDNQGGGQDIPGQLAPRGGKINCYTGCFFSPKLTFSYNISGIWSVSNSLDPNQVRTICLAWFGPKMFAKIISRWQRSSFNHYPATIFVLKMPSAFYVRCIYLNALQTRFFHGSKQYDNCPYCLQHSLPKKRSRGGEQRAKVVTGGKWVNS